MTLLFLSLPDFGRKIGRHAVRFQDSIERVTKLSGFGCLAQVKKRWFRALAQFFMQSNAAAPDCLFVSIMTPL